MRRLPRYAALIILVLLLTASTSNAVNIDIIESQSFNANHVMDQQWANVATGLGYVPTIHPQSALDTGSFIPTSDLLIVSSGVISLPPNRILTILATMASGVGVYIQTEADPTLSTSSAWLDLVADQFASFTWDGTTIGTLSPMRITGTASSTPNPTQLLPGFMDGAHGTGSQEIETILHFADKEYGWYLRPQAGQIVMAATTTDQDWIINLTNTSLMENLMSNLITVNSTHLQVRLWFNGPPIVLPNTGGSFQAMTQAFYTGFTPITFDAWTRIVLPNGNFFGPILNYSNLTMQPQTTSTVYTFNQFIPGFAPAGTYYLHAGLGTYGGYEYNIDAIEFTKLVVAADGQPSVNDWQSTPLQAVNGQLLQHNLNSQPQTTEDIER